VGGIEFHKVELYSRSGLSKVKYNMSEESSVKREKVITGI
jgi:hypothetical protein